MAQDKYCVVDPVWELIDPNPDIHVLFSEFNEMFFWGKLNSVYVVWSPRMTLCAGMCRYHPRNRECSIHMSKPLLSYRPRKDLVETLLHEMIHAYLFIADGDRERESHGPKFHEHMFRINHLTGANITVYHSFHDEVNHFKTHWWKCNGPCQHRPPYYGVVKRSMNRAPGPNDFWYKDHQQNCGGQFTKIKEPSPKKTAKRKKDEGKSVVGVDENKGKNKITNYFTPGKSGSQSNSISEFNASATATSATASTSSGFPDMSSFETFSGRGNLLGSIENNSGRNVNSISRNLFGDDTGIGSGSSSGSGSQWQWQGDASTATSSQGSSGSSQSFPGQGSALGSSGSKSSSSASGNLLGSSSTSGSGHRLGGAPDSKLMRLGDHPLLLRLASKQTKPTSSSNAAPSSKSQKARNDHIGDRSSKSDSSGKGTGSSRKAKIEVIDLD